MMYVIVNPQSVICCLTNSQATAKYYRDQEGCTYHEVQDPPSDCLNGIFKDMGSTGNLMYVPKPRQPGNWIVVDGNWVDQTTEDQKIEAVREQRNQALASSDWTQLADVPLSESKKEEWRLWRQQVRDLFSNTSNADAAKAELDVLLANKP